MSLPTPMEIGNTEIPQTDEGGNIRLGGYGNYVFKQPEVVGDNGAGLSVVAGYSTVVWTWDSLTHTDYIWLTNTLLTGEPSKAFADNLLYDDSWVLTPYSYCVVRRPTYESIDGNYVNNVVLRIDRIIP